MYRNKSENVYTCLVDYYATLDRDPDDQGILDIDVSFDGSWLTRGYQSHIGVGAVIDAYTGFVVDFHVCSNYCVICNRLEEKRNKNKISDVVFQEKMNNHRNNCNRNFDGEASSGAMEAEEARVMWGRSLAHKFRYINFIGDGDSSAFNKVMSMNDSKGPYADVNKKIVVKQECVNHVGKRFGTRLRKARDEQFEWRTDKKGKAYKKKILSGKNKLTENVISHLSF